MDGKTQQRHWFWATLALSSITIIGVVFAVWELVETRFFRDLDYVTLHYLYISRGIVTSLLLAFWAAWFVLRERKGMEEQLQRSSEHYRGILDCAPGAVVLFDRQLRVWEWNAAAERLYGFRQAEVLGTPLPTIGAEEETEMRAAIAQVEQDRPVLDVETQRRARNGSRIEVQLSLLPFCERGGQTCFLEVTHDIRERIRLRETLLQVEKLTTMGKMAAGTAHHLNTPLASMLLRLRMMREGKFEGSVDADLGRLEGSVAFCQKFVRRLLDFSRGAQSQKQPEALGTTLEAVAGFLSPQFLAKQVALDLELDGASQTRVLADRNQLEALFLILLSNAIDAVERGGRVRVACRKNGERIEVQVADNGCGIPPELLPRIFEPFFTTKPPGKGTGLGLAIAGNILQEHGGTMRFDSTPQHGTTAVVELPLWREAAAGATA
jgi:PAS domain S-box-containing protein